MADETLLSGQEKTAPENKNTPRVFIAATRMNDGKTTVALGLMSALRERSLRIGFIKPVGQRFVEVDGHKIDEDSVLISQVFGGSDPIAETSPVAVEPEFTRKYLQSGGHDGLVKKVIKAFDRIAWEKEFVVIEGTGHAGVGSVFDLSNATVAKLLNAKVILVTQGGIGRPIDEAALNKALFDKMGVELIGVVMNKVLPEKITQLSDFARKGFKRIGVDLLGVIPRQIELESPTLSQITAQLDARFINGDDQSNRSVQRVVIGAMSSRYAMDYFLPGTLVITPGDREDLILAALSSSALGGKEAALAGIILSDDHIPHHNVLEMIRRSTMPVMSVALDSYSVASKIHDLTVKTRAADNNKIQTIRNLIRSHLDIDRILKVVGNTNSSSKVD
jgi:BioD-like phosphotransacetylase family protein